MSIPEFSAVVSGTPDAHLIWEYCTPPLCYMILMGHWFSVKFPFFIDGTVFLILSLFLFFHLCLFVPISICRHLRLSPISPHYSIHFPLLLHLSLSRMPLLAGSLTWTLPTADQTQPQNMDLNDFSRLVLRWRNRRSCLWSLQAPNLWSFLAPTGVIPKSPLVRLRAQLCYGFIVSSR
jgi:hypothetical protein